MGDKLKASSNARQDKCTKLNESRILSENITKETEKTVSCLKGHSEELETSKEGIINQILQKRNETTKSYVNLKKESDVSNKLQILSKVMQRSDETTAFSNKLKTAIDSDNNLRILSKVNQDEMTRLPELREKSETRIVTKSNKLIRSSQTISCLKEDSEYITTS